MPQPPAAHPPPAAAAGAVPAEPPLAPGTARLSELDRYWPPAGPCGICGGPDARHRIFDQLLGRSLTGESVAELARDFGVPVDAVRAVVEDPARLAEWEIMAALASLDARQEARPVERR